MAKEQPTGTADKKAPSILRVVEQLDSRIAAGIFVPGQRLIEADLSAELGASRGSVREALRFLAGDGVVELLPYRGAQVKPIPLERMAEMLEVFGGLFHMSMDLLVKKRISAGAKRDIMAEIAILEKAETQHPAQIVGAMIGYHEAIIIHTGNSFLIELVGKLHLKYYSLQLASQYSHDVWVDACKYYFSSVELLFKKDAVKAYEVLSGSLQSMVANLRKKASA